jgi:hypothetical protein
VHPAQLAADGCGQNKQQYRHAQPADDEARRRRVLWLSVGYRRQTPSDGTGQRDQPEHYG